MRRARYRLAASHLSALKGSLLSNGITTFWFTSTLNFGDLLSPSILMHYGFTPILTPPESCRVLSTGSILEAAPRDFDGHVLGSGLIRDVTVEIPRARIWGVRGRLSWERVGAPEDVTLGDPGLLAHKLIHRREEKRRTLGIVPHFEDMDDPSIGALSTKYPDEVDIIDVRRRPSRVLRDIDRCEHILSSSLHGVVAADSLGIPNAWIRLSNRVIGEGFKFRDYASALDTSLRPSSLTGDETLTRLLKRTREPSSRVPFVAQGLDRMFTRFQNHIRGDRESHPRWVSA